MTSSPVSSPNRHLFHEGQVIAQKYRLIRPLDEGGMGQVWVAENVDLDACVALKLLRTGSDAADRLKREARLLAKLDHPAIVRVLDSGRTQHGTPFLVTELLHGETLANILWQSDRLSPEESVQILLPILEGLRVAHERGIVHRDLKPANIFLARLASGRRQPKVLDFGIASIRDWPELRGAGEGVLLGSPVYMSPEQARGLHTDARTDIWALCLLLYEMVTGEPPFEGSSHRAVLQAVVLDEPKSLAEHGIDDLALWALIKRGMAKDRENRWADVETLGRLLAEWLITHGITEDITCSSVRATWLAQDVAEVTSSYPPVSKPARSSRDAITVGGDAEGESLAPRPAEAAPSIASTTLRTTPLGSDHRLWNAAVLRRACSGTTLAWLGGGAFVGVAAVFAYAFLAFGSVRSSRAPTQAAALGAAPAAFTGSNESSPSPPVIPADLNVANGGGVAATGGRLTKQAGDEHESSRGGQRQGAPNPSDASGPVRRVR